MSDLEPDHVNKAKVEQDVRCELVRARWIKATLPFLGTKYGSS